MDSRWPNWLRAALYPGAITLVLIAVALHWTHPGYLIGQSDLNPPDHIWNQLKQCVAPWNYTQSYLGQSSWCFTYSPWLFVHALLASAFGDSFADTLRLILPYILAVWGAYYCGRVLQLSRSSAALLAFVYVLNPFTQVIIGLNMAVPIFTALFAWICAVLMLAALQPNKRAACALALCAIFSFAVVSTTIMPHLLVDLVFGLAIWLPLCFRSADSRRSYARWLGVTGLGVCASVLWWLIPSVISLASSENYRPHTVSDNAWTFIRASLLNMMRLNPVWLWGLEIYFPEAPAYDANPVTFGFSMFLSITLVAAMARLRGKLLWSAAYLGLAALAILFISKGAHGPLAPVSSFIMSLPVLFVFQDPAGLIVIATFAFAIIAAWFVSGLETSAIYSRVAKLGIATMAAISAMLFINGNVFHGNGPIALTMYLRIPHYWTDLGYRLDGDASPGGVLMLPPEDQYDVTYTWDYIGADTVPISTTMRRVLVPEPPFGYFINSERSSLYAKLVTLIDSGSPLAGPVLNDLGIRFIVLRGDAHTSLPHISAQALRHDFPNAPQTQYGQLTLVDLGNPRPGITDWTSWIEHDGKLDAGEIAEAEALTDDTRPRFSSSDRMPSSKPALFESSVSGAIIDTSHRSVVPRPSIPWRGAVAANTSASVRLAFDQQVAPPDDDSPYIISWDALSKAPAMLPAITLFPQLTSFRPPYRFANPASESVDADIDALCHACRVGAAITAIVNGKEYRATVVRDRASDTVVHFSIVRIGPGYNTIGFKVPPNAAIRFDDITFKVLERSPRKIKHLAAYYPISSAMASLPFLSDPYVGTRFSDDAGWILYLRPPHGESVACFLPIDIVRSYNLYAAGLDCLQRNGLPNDPQSLSTTILSGIGLRNAPARGDAHHRYLSSRIVVKINDNGLRALPSRESALAPRLGRYARVWHFTQASSARDIVDAFIPKNWYGNINEGLMHGPPFKTIPIDGGTAFGSTGLPSRNIFSLTSGAHLGPGTSLTIWRHDDRFAIATGKTTVAGAAVAGTVANVAIANANHSTQVATPNGSPASMMTIEADHGRYLPAQSCEGGVMQPVLRCHVVAGSTLVMNVGFHWEWIAMQGFSPLRHLEADGWRNAWSVERSGDVFIVNSVDLLLPLLFLMTLSGFAFFGWRLLRRTA